MPKGFLLIIDKLFQVQMDLYSLFSISVSTELKKFSTRNYLSVIYYLANLHVVPQSNFPVIHRVGNFDIFTGRNVVVAKVIFLHLFVILFTGGCLPQCMLGYHPPEQTPPPLRADTPGADTPRADTPQSRHSPGADKPPWSRHPPPSRHPPRADTPRAADPPEQQTPQSRHPLGTDTPPPPPGADTPPEQTPLREADFGIRSMSGRYASYWNAFLLY